MSRLLVWCVCIGATMGVLCAACRPSESTRLQEQAAPLLHSEDWEQRNQGLLTLSQLPHDQIEKLAPKTRQLLSQVFSRDVQEILLWKANEEKTGKTQAQVREALNVRYPPQTRGEYERMLGSLVTANHLEESLPILFDYMAYGNHMLSTGYLTLFGKPALTLLKLRATSHAVEERELAVATLGVWAEPTGESDDFDMTLIPPLTDAERTQAVEIIKQALQDPDYNVRDSAVSGLAAFLGRPDIRQLVERVAVSDSETFIRKEAERILKKQPKH